MRPTAPLFRLVRRLPLTTKQGPKDYYKGTGTGSMGWHTKRGRYRIDWAKVRTYEVPAGLADFKLTPFVAKSIPRPTYYSVLDGRSKSAVLSDMRALAELDDRAPLEWADVEAALGREVAAEERARGMDALRDEEWEVVMRGLPDGHDVVVRHGEGPGGRAKGPRPEWDVYPLRGRGFLWTWLRDNRET